MVTPARAQETSVASLKARLEGAYVLESWQHANGEILRPPAVDARAVLVSGRVMFIAHDRGPDPDSQTTVAGFGTYTLEPGKFSYSYERYTVVSQAPGGTFVSETLPWEGMRTFAASIDNNYPYTHSSGLFDVTSGSNGSCSNSQWCNARTGWDGPTGLGTPNGVSAF